MSRYHDFGSCPFDRHEWVSFPSLQSAVTLLELKKVKHEDLNAVLELDQVCFGGLWTLAAYQRELDSPNSDLIGLFISSPIFPSPPPPLIPRGGTEFPLTRSPLLGIGCSWAILEEAHITILAVHPHYQRQGLGQALLISLLTAASLRGLERATLEVRPSNQPALSLYQKFGFKTAGRRRHYYQDTNEDALILWRGDLQHPEFEQTLANWECQVRDRLTLAGWDLQNFKDVAPQ